MAFPQRKNETGESPEAALIRKIKEDLNIDVTVGSRIDTTEYDYPAIHLSMDCDWGHCKRNNQAFRGTGS